MNKARGKQPGRRFHPVTSTLVIFASGLVAFFTIYNITRLLLRLSNKYYF